MKVTPNLIMPHLHAKKVAFQVDGFTLLELLVALTIFAVIAVMAYSGLNTILILRQHTDQHAAQLAELQLAFSQFARDIEQQIERQIRDEYGDSQPALKGTVSQLEFTRTGWRNPAQQPRSTLQRVAYHLDNQILWRSYWRVLDRAQDSRAEKVALLNAVTEFKLRFLDTSLQWHETWSPKNPINPDPNQPVELPKLRAIEVTLKIVDWGTLTRLFQVVDK